MAIANENSANLGEIVGTSLTEAYTCTGSDLILFVGFQLAGTPDVTTVTYDGVAMTQVDVKTEASSTAYLYFLTNPATGSNNVVISRTSSAAILGIASSYTGANPTGQPDSDNTGGNVSTSLSVSTTTVSDNSWTIMMVKSSGGGLAAGASTTFRQQGQNTGVGIFDSNGAITPAGSTSLNVTMNNGDNAGVLASFSVLGLPAETNSNFLMFM